jgi:hypothetical protein
MNRCPFGLGSRDCELLASTAGGPSSLPAEGGA